MHSLMQTVIITIYHYVSYVFYRDRLIGSIQQVCIEGINKGILFYERLACFRAAACIPFRHPDPRLGRSQRALQVHALVSHCGEPDERQGVLAFGFSCYKDFSFLSCFHAVASLAKPGTFAGNDAIVAFARNHQLNVVIHQLNAPLWQVGHRFASSSYALLCKLFWGRANGGAWPVLLNREGQLGL